MREKANEHIYTFVFSSYTKDKFSLAKTWAILRNLQCQNIWHPTAWLILNIDIKLKKKVVSLKPTNLLCAMNRYVHLMLVFLLLKKNKSYKLFYDTFYDFTATEAQGLFKIYIIVITCSIKIGHYRKTLTWKKSESKRKIIE